MPDTDVGSTPYAIAVDGEVVYLGGDFTGVMAGMPQDTYLRIARWDGSSWSRLGDGLDGTVRALCVVGGTIFAGGEFSVAGGTAAAARLARWDGERWSDVGGGVSYADVASMAVVRALASDGTRLYVAGTFDRVGRGAAAVPAAGLAAFDLESGTWSALGTGLTNLGSPGEGRALVMDGARLYVGGQFASAGSGAAANIARWDGTSWSAVGSGLNGTGYAVTVLGGRLYVGGEFTAAGATTASGVAMWDPGTETWSALGNAPVFDDAVLGLAALDDRYLVAGGEYNAFRRGGRDLVRGLNGMVLFDTLAQVDPDDPTSGYYVVAGVKRSSGTGTVRALQVLGGDLYVGGSFDTAGVLDLTSPQESGFAAQNLAVWHVGGDGTWSTPGGADQPVQAFSTLDGAQLVLAGWFSVAGSIRAKGVATYDPGTATWGGFGSGLGEGLRGVLHGEALAHDPASGTWVGGTFNTAGGGPSCSIALWTATAGRS